MLLGGSNGVDIEMSRSSGSGGGHGDHVVVRRRGQPSSVADSHAFTGTGSSSYRGGMSRASPTTPNTSTLGSRRNNANNANNANSNDVGFAKRMLGKILLPSTTTSTDSTNARSRGGKGGRGGDAVNAAGDGGIHVNQAIRDTLDPIWMSDSFLKQLVKSR
eukprot:TRINITY_DN21875_c0_g1_i1.p1 TRINITY_DN21875_c0_g1~~TRINITY_DN21875_c0_g1_i1.p1  ORF type:complete len:161 (-),score=19.26 TRINITY_DN21875_c0_g1_i1:330-812(-)